MATRDLAQSVIVVTGASSGFGKGAAIEFARAGAKVVLAARRDDLLDEVANECSGEGGDALAGNHENHPGDCQCMIPGSTISSRSRISASNGSGSSGAATGSFARISPGCTFGAIGSSPTRSM